MALFSVFSLLCSTDQKFYDLDSELRKFRELRERDEVEKEDLLNSKNALESQLDEIQRELKESKSKIIS